MGYSQEDASAGDTVIPDLFLVSSAIANDYGIYDRYEKCSQLIQTIESIHRYHSRPHDIVVIDASPVAVPDQLSDTISNMCLGFYQCHDHPVLQDLHDPDLNQGVLKSIGEQIIWRYLYELIDRLLPKTYDRIFKISGRYQLNTNFKRSDHDQPVVVCGLPRSWPYKNQDQIEMLTVIPTRLWSFPWAAKELMRQVFIDVDRLSSEIWTNLGEIHLIEKLLYQSLNLNHVPMQHLPMLGVQGHLAQDGVFVSE